MSSLGIRLVLMLGPTVPLPAPYPITSALLSAEVTNDVSANGDGFQLTFAAGHEGITRYGLVSNPLLKPMTRVILGVAFGVAPEVLIDGIITHTQFNPGTNPGQATLTLTGRDLTAVMDLKEKNATHPNQADFAIVSKIIGTYASYGISPASKPTFETPLMLERTPNQQGTDLRYLRSLAEDNGFVFYLEPLTFGTSLAYFGPAPRLGRLEPALSVNLGASNNVTSLTFSNDALAPVTAQGEILEPRSKSALPIPPLPSLKVPPLAAKPATPLRTRLQRDTSQASPGRAAAGLLATGMNAPDPYTAQGELDSSRYGHALRARRLVGVRGAGWTHDGVWAVRSVTHSFSRQGYTQRFQLSREGAGSTLPILPP